MMRALYVYSTLAPLVSDAALTSTARHRSRRSRTGARRQRVKRLQAVVAGRVQGVGFREFVRR